MINQEMLKEDPALLISWAEAMLFPESISKNLKSCKEDEFLYHYLKAELAGFDNTNYKVDFFSLMQSKYNFSQQDLERKLENVKKARIKEIN